MDQGAIHITDESSNLRFALPVLPKYHAMENYREKAGNDEPSP
ncbi:MAG: hypothetical protein WAK01_04435 [Methylocystis sp.]